MSKKLMVLANAIHAVQVGLGGSHPHVGTGPRACALRHMQLLARRQALALRHGYELNEIAWNVLVALYAGRHNGHEMLTGEIYLATGIAQTTSHRYLDYLHSTGLMSRRSDHIDRRRTYVRLTDEGVWFVERYLTGSD